MHGSKPPTSQVSTYEGFSEWEIPQNPWLKPWLKPCVLYGLMYLFNAQKLVHELTATDPTTQVKGHPVPPQIPSGYVERTQLNMAHSKSGFTELKDGDFPVHKL